MIYLQCNGREFYSQSAPGCLTTVSVCGGIFVTGNLQNLVLENGGSLPMSFWLRLPVEFRPTGPDWEELRNPYVDVQYETTFAVIMVLM